MPKYQVCLPIVGHLWTTVTAKNETAAIAKALNKSYEVTDIEEFFPCNSIVVREEDKAPENKGCLTVHCTCTDEAIAELVLADDQKE
jgi:hypothetical protein